MRLSVVYLVIQTVWAVWALPLQPNKTDTAEYEQLQSISSYSQLNAEPQTGVQYLEISNTKHQRLVEEGESREDSKREGPKRDPRDLLRKQPRFAHLSLGANLGPVGKLGLSAGLGPGMTGLGLGAQLGQLGGGAALALTSTGFFIRAAAGQRDHYLDLAEFYKYNNYNNYNGHLSRNSPPLLPAQYLVF